MRKVLLLVNSLFEHHRNRSLPRLLEGFERAGVAVDVQESGSDRAGGEKARLAAANGTDAVIVCGGDGTIFDVVQGMAGSPVPLGIVPFGTGNILAQNLKIPKDPRAAAGWLLRSRPVSVPLGRITCTDESGSRTWLFVMSAGMGGHANLVGAAHRVEKQAAGPAAYYVSGIKLLLQLPIQPFEVEVTTTENHVERRQVCEALALHVAKLNIWRTGGGLEMPFLRLATVEGNSFLRLVGAAAEALFGGGGVREGGAAHYENAVRVVCRPLPGYQYKVPILVQADGEVLGTSQAEIEMAGLNIQLLTTHSA